MVVHGGAWSIPDSLVKANIAGVEAAARAGMRCLRAGGPATDAVEAAVVELENNPVFDAGVGSVLNEDGEVEMDAMIMQGSDMSVGAVVGIRDVANPVRVANQIRTRTEHCMFAGAGASNIARELGFPSIDPSSLVTQAGRDEWEHFQKYGRAVDALFTSTRNEGVHDTVGAVACNEAGECATATSTGGITAKRKGRVGDSAIPGSGGYADDAEGAVSTTGHGESIMRVNLALRVLNNLARLRGVTTRKPKLPMACKEALQFMNQRVQSGGGGVIAVDNEGNYAIEHTTSRMAWAVASIVPGSTGTTGVEEILIESGITRNCASIQ